MTFINEDTYTKPIVGGDYILRRIIDGDGKETSNWPLWMSYAKTWGLKSILTYRHRASGDPCHYDFL